MSREFTRRYQRFEIRNDFAATGAECLGTIGRNDLARLMGVESDVVECLFENMGFIRHGGKVYEFCRDVEQD